jgi:hypothetical protein
MKDRYESFDELLRRRLQDAAAPPPPSVWPEVESALQRRRRRFILWLTGLGISLSAIGYMAYKWKTQEQLQQQQQIALQVQEQPVAAVTAGVSQPNRPTTQQPYHRTAQQPNRPTTQPPNHPTAQQPNHPPEEQALPSELLHASIPELRTASSIMPVQSRDTMIVAGLPWATHLPLFADKKHVSAPVKQIPMTLPRKKKEPRNCYDFEEHPNVWFADAYAGPGWTDRSLSSPDPEFQNYSRLRGETERTDMAFNAGLRASLLLNRHYLLRAGLHYDQFTEIFEYADPNFIEYTVKVRTELIGGVWQTVTDTVGVDYGEHYQKTYNRYGMLDIPVMLGGEWRRGRTGFSLQVGAALNVFFWNGGAMLSAQGVPVDFNDTTPAFRTRTGASVMGSVQWFWHIQPRLRVFAEPYYRRMLRPVTMDAYPVRQQYSLLGIQLGVTKILD